MNSKFASVVLFMFLLLLAVTASAQDKKVEITGFVGYTLSEGIEGDGVIIDGNVFNSINPTNALSYGFTFGYFVTENVEVGFLYDQQDSTLEIKGPTIKEELADMKLRNYHGIFTYNWGDDRSVARPFLLGGIGATQYSPRDIMGSPVEGNTMFSSTWGGGIKLFPGENVGIQVMGLDANLYQVRSRRHLVQPILGVRLLAGQQSGLLEPIRVLGWHRAPFLIGPEGATGMPRGRCGFPRLLRAPLSPSLSDERLA